MRQAPVLASQVPQDAAHAEQGALLPTENRPAPHAVQATGDTLVSYPNPAGQVAHEPVAATQVVHEAAQARQTVAPARA